MLNFIFIYNLKYIKSLLKDLKAIRCMEYFGEFHLHNGDSYATYAEKEGYDSKGVGI